MTELVERMPDSMLTTEDNPYDPFEEYEKWWTYDFEHGYKTPELLARVAVVSEELSDSDLELAIDQAIQDILEFDPLGIYIKVTRESAKRLIPSLHKENTPSAS